MTTREEFENWRRSINPHTQFVRHETAYVSMILEDQWQAWQASRAAALEEAAKECEKAYSYDPEALVIADKIRAIKEN
jgi:hypothetical protein